MGLDNLKRVLVALATSTIYLYKLTFIASLYIFSTYGVLTNSVGHNSASFVVSLVILAVLIILSIQQLYKPLYPVTKPIDKLFCAGTLTSSFITLVLSIQWGLVVPFTPYLFVLSLIHYIFLGKNQIAIVYALIYNITLFLQFLDLFPIFPYLAVWPDIGKATKLIYLIGNILATESIIFAGKYISYMGLLFIPTSKDYITKLFQKGLLLDSLEHRVRNLLNNIKLTSSTDTQNLLNLLNLFKKDNITLNKFINKIQGYTTLLHQMYPNPQYRFVVTQEVENIQQDVSRIYIPLVFDILENAFKHGKNTITIKLNKLNKTHLQLIVTNDINSISTKHKKNLSFIYRNQLILTTLKKASIKFKTSKKEFTVIFFIPLVDPNDSGDKI